MKIVVGITGATGTILGVRIVQALTALGVEVHLVFSRWGKGTLQMESDISISEVFALAHQVYSHGDMSAAISSGSYRTDGMIIAPCSMKTLGAIRSGYGDGLVPRAADVTLKERRKLVLVPRELPLSEIHLENMLALARMGAAIVPPMLSFYQRPQTLDDVVEYICCRILDQFGLTLPGAYRWHGPSRPADHERTRAAVE